MEELHKAIEARQWYPLVGILLWYTIAAWKKYGAQYVIWRVREGWRWLPPVLLAAAGGFVDGFATGLPWDGACWRAGYAVLGIALTAMGMQGALKESPLGGPPGRFSLTIALAFVGFTACGGPPEVVRSPAPPADAGAELRLLGSDSSGLDREADFAGVRYGAVVVTLKIAEGVQKTILCGGHIEYIEDEPASEPADAGRELLKLDRGQP